MQPTKQLQFGGLCARPLTLTREDLARFPPEAQVADVGVLVAGRAGRAVTLAALRARAGEAAGAAFLDVASADPGFAVSLPLAEVRSALILYELDGGELPGSKGGPFRLLVPGHGDECVHVKQIARLELSAVRGRDTRPVDDVEHCKLHGKKRS